jgi:ceramide synthetase
MSIHQIVTLSACVMSYWYGWNRVGVVVMFLLDPADVPLHLAKLCKYIGDATAGAAFSSWLWSFFADIFFLIFAASFFIMRLVVFPYVCWSAHVEATRYFPKGKPEWISVALLEMLLALQVYWFSLIVKVATRVIRVQMVYAVAEGVGLPQQKKLN